MDETNEREIIEYPTPPKHVKVLPNGAGYNMQTKRISHKPGTFAPAPNHKPELMAQARWNKTRQAIESAIISQAYANGLDVSNGADVIAIGAGALMQDVLTGAGTLRDRNKVLWDIARYAGLVQDAQTPVQSAQTNVINIGIDALRTILDKTGGQVLDM